MEKANDSTPAGTPEQKETEYIGHYQEAPTYMKDNEGITHGYRINFNNPWKILKSLFMIHNESVNIWTHLFPALFILVVIPYILLFVVSFTMPVTGEKMALTEGVNSYSHALHNFTQLAEMKNAQAGTSTELQEMHDCALKSYEEFVQHLTEWERKAIKHPHDDPSPFHSFWQTQFEQFSTMKNNFEQAFIPYVLNSINHQLDYAYLEGLKQNLEQVKTNMDSHWYDFIEGSYQHIPNLHMVSRWPIFVFLGSAVVCLMCSALFHLFYPMSGRAYQMFNRLDFAGINILIAGSSFPPLYYAFYCNFHVAYFYLTFVWIGGCVLFVISFFPWLHRNQNTTVKVLLYGGFGTSLSIPLAHITINQMVFSNYDDLFQMSGSVPFYLAAGFSYLFGLYVYAVRCPERNRPGQFNVCGHSHQIWHCLVVLGIVFTYVGVLQNFQMRKTCACPV